LSKNNPSVLLDFDGVLFDSIAEVYEICKLVAIRDPELRQDITFSEFCEFRKFVSDAWHYRILYSPTYDGDAPAARLLQDPSPDDRIFSKEFFRARSELIGTDLWINAFRPYEFFYSVRDLIRVNVSAFTILSSRDSISIKSVLKHYGLEGVGLVGQEHIRKYGSKRSAAECLGLIHAPQRTLIIDDLEVHLNEFDDSVIKVQADWGYGDSSKHALSMPRTLRKLKKFLRPAV
jgi:hypothetical protein